MNKIRFALLSVYCLTHANLQAAETDANPVDACRHAFHNSVDVQLTVLDFLPAADQAAIMNTSKVMRRAALQNAALDYANALLADQRVPDDAMHILRTARTDILYKGISERQHVINCILDPLTNQGIISLPNAIPPFLREYVVDHTSGVQRLIDSMPLNPHIAEHMKHSIGHYYEYSYCGGFYNPRTENSVDVIQNRLNSMTQEYKLLDDAVKNGADLTGVKYVVIPDVGADDTAITSRENELDALFSANPKLTLVVSFADDVHKVNDNFCSAAGLHSVCLSRHVKRLSFTGKNVETISNHFFSNAHALTDVDFRGLSNLQKVDYHFFSNAHALTDVDFRGLSKLTTVRDFFFLDALFLDKADFSGLSALRNVGGYFFYGARALTSVTYRNAAQAALLKAQYYGKAEFIIVSPSSVEIPTTAAA